jgi:hypothetical protein
LAFAVGLSGIGRKASSAGYDLAQPMMTNADTGPWPIRLQRSPVRLFVLVAARAAIGVAALVTAIPEPGTLGTALSFAGVIVLGYAALLGLDFVTMRLQAVPGQLRVRSLFVSRRYQLAKGDVRRLRLPPGWRFPVGAAFRGLGVRIGPGQLEGEKLVGVIALARPASLLMVPTTDGRLAIAVASEKQLLDALMRATRRPSRAPAIRLAIGRESQTARQVDGTFRLDHMGAVERRLRNARIRITEVEISFPEDRTDGEEGP